MKSRKGCFLPTVSILFLLLLIGVGVRLVQNRSDEESGRSRGSGRRVPVEVTSVQRGSIEEILRFSGTLEPSAESRVAARVGGRVLEVKADLADAVIRGQELLTLDAAEFRQQLARAEADLAVARARQTEAQNRLTIATREQERIQKLSERGVSSESALDAAKAEYLVRTSAVEVAASEVAAAEAALETARIQLEDTRVPATWSDGDSTRVVAERYVEEGDTVQANAPLFRVVEVDSLRAVIFVPERDYGRLKPGLPVSLSSDAWPGETFPAEIARVSPVFEENSRQARVEIRVPNPDLRLKPGMFVRASVVLEVHEDALLVPEAALTRRDGTIGVFLVDPEGPSASWIPVTPGIRQSGTVELVDADLTGQVVVLGQQLLDDGSLLILPEAEPQ